MTVALLVAAAPTRADAGAVVLEPGPHLFVDGWLIDVERGLRRVVERPRRYGPPIVDGVHDHNTQPYVTVLREGGRFRMWYTATTENDPRGHLGYLESRDGVRWHGPHRVLADPSPMLFPGNVLHARDEYLLPFFSWDFARRNAYADPMAGMWLAHSDDGLRWQSVRTRPVLPMPGDILHLHFDSRRDRYIALVKMAARPGEYPGRPPNGDYDGYRRLVGQATSSDGRSWSEPQRVVVPDVHDPEMTEFYGIGGVVERGGLLLGLLRVLLDDEAATPGGPVNGTGHTVLVWSRDGRTWRRDRAQRFLDRNRRRRSWDHAVAWASSQVTVGDRTLIYYGGYDAGHKTNRYTGRQLGLAIMQRDRYVARADSAGRGRLRTRAVRLTGRALTVNARVRGSLDLRVLSESGRPLHGYGFADCRVAGRDGVALPVRCRGRVAALRGRSVRLEARLERARLYALGVR